MKSFMDDNFLLETKTAEKLYHEHAAKMPILDYHCHLNPKEIAEDRCFDNLGEIWLEGDHYKWRAMRANGVEEKFITGRETSFWEKYEKWADTVPYTMRNPLYHWTHLELKRVFGVTKLLKPETAKEIFDECTARLRTPEFSARNIMKKFNVRVVCTTDDPVDSLEYHASLKKESFEIKVLPTWRPDRAMAVENPEHFRSYVEKLAVASNTNIATFPDFMNALQKRHDFFESLGCRLSDRGLEEFYAEDYTQAEIDIIFNKIYGSTALNQEEILKFKSAMMFELGVMDANSGWTQQFHFGVIRNNNSRLMAKVGADAGCDSICDLSVAKNLSKFLNRLNSAEKLSQTILYNLNPRDNDLVATMIGNFQDGSMAGKMQFGSGWWFLDQKYGMEAQMNSLSSQGLLSRFVGMLTDSRSFLSYPRHEYFRRILCNLIGNDVERGELPSSEMAFLGKMVEDICYNNANRFFKF